VEDKWPKGEVDQAIHDVEEKLKKLRRKDHIPKSLTDYILLLHKKGFKRKKIIKILVGDKWPIRIVERAYDEVKKLSKIRD